MFALKYDYRLILQNLDPRLSTQLITATSGQKLHSVSLCPYG